MKFKKQTAICLAALLLSAQGAYALELGDTSAQPIVVTGSAEAGTEAAAAVKDSEGNFYFYDEVKSDASGKYQLIFELPEDLKNKTISVEIKPQGKTEESISFEFSGKTLRDEAMSTLVAAAGAKDADAFSAALSNEDYKTALDMLGIPVDSVNANASVESGAVALLLENGTTETDLIVDFNRCFFTISKKNNYKEGAKQSFDSCNFVFDSVAYADEEDENKKTWVKEKMLSSDNIATIETAESEYERLNAYYLMNNAKYTDIPTLVENYKDELELTDTQAYKDFTAMSSSEKYKVAEKIVTNSSFGTLSDGFEQILKNAVSAVKNSQSGSTGSGGTSGGGGGSSSSSGSTSSSGIMTGTVVATPVLYGVFNDVSDGDWYFEAVSELNNQGIVSGKDDGNFAPDDNVTREEFLAMLIRALGKGDTQSNIDLTYKDVKTGAWYENTVKVAVETGLASGYGEDLFGIGDNITRQDAAVFAARAAEANGQILDYTKHELFGDDGDISDYAKAYVYAMKNGNIISGMGDNTYMPSSPCTRAQAATIVYKLLKGANI